MAKLICLNNLRIINMFSSDQDFTPPKNLYDFRAWTELISKIDVNDNSSMTGQTSQLCNNNFRTFLKAFPWLHKYWTKFAQFIWSAKYDLKTVEPIFVEALSRNTLIYSVDMWLEYIKFFQTHLAQTEQHRLRGIFASALDAVGSLYNSSEIWHMALNYENEHRRTRFFLLSKVISYPVSELKQFWAELQTILPRVPVGQLKQFDPNKTVTELFSETEQVSNQVLPPNAEIQARAEANKRLSDLYNASLKMLSKRYGYEINITRQHFDFISPDEIQIGNWEAYASMLEKEYNADPSWVNYNSVVQCYERAIIPCAFVDSIWLNYANFLEDAANSHHRQKFASVEDARAVYNRIPYQVLPSAKIVQAEFEEVYSSTLATELYNQMALSNYAEQIVAAAYYAQRTINEEEAAAVLRSAAVRLIENNDLEGGSVIAATLLNLKNEATANAGGAVYLTEYARRLIQSDPEQSSMILYDFIYKNENTPPLEDRILVLDIYLEYARTKSMPADFQLNLENERNKLRNKLVFNQDYFNNSYMLSARHPEQKLREWLATSSSTI